MPEQFSWVDQQLVQCGLIDRLDPVAAALYLFLVTVADAQGLSYYGAATLSRRLHLSEAQLVAARSQLIERDLIAYQAPLYQVLALPAPASRRPLRQSAPALPRSGESSAGPVSLAQLLEMERGRARL
ncbi:MAG: hypothetical protein ACRDIC_00805 [bacterium]